MSRLTDRTEMTSAPADGDLQHIVDVSDTTDNEDGTSKKITWATIKAAIASYLSIKAPVVAEANTTLIGPGVSTLIFEDAGAAVSAHPTTLSTTITFTKSYTAGYLLKGDIVCITAASDEENLGTFFVVGRYPPDLDVNKIEVDGHLTLGGTIDVKIYRHCMSIDEHGRVRVMATAQGSAGHTDSDILYNITYEHNLGGQSPGKVVGLHIGDYNNGTEPDLDHPIEVYRYDYGGSALWYLTGTGKSFQRDTLNVVAPASGVGANITGTVNITGTANISGGGVDIQHNWNGKSRFRVYNTNTGASAFACMAAGYGTTTSTSFELYAFGANYSGSGAYSPLSCTINSGSGYSNGLNIALQSTAAGAGFNIFTNNGSKRLSVKQDGDVCIGAGAAVSKLTVEGITTPGTDNTFTLGTATYRWSEIFAGTGTINTSDAREKTSVLELTKNEIAASKALSKEIGTYQFLSAVAEKGGSARTHIGMTVQRAIEIMESFGLDPRSYGFICHDIWSERAIDHPAKYDVLVGIDGETVIGKDVVEGAWMEIIPAGDRYGFRYNELLMFIARGVEARLSALENKSD